MKHFGPRFWIVAVVLSLLPTACRRVPGHKAVRDGKIDACSMSGDYFPTLEQMNHVSGFSFGQDQISWESNFLRHMQEPSLFACAQNSQEPAYRLLLDRSLRQPMSARLVIHRDGSGTLLIRILANAGVPLPASLDQWYKLILSREQPLTRDQVASALALYARMPFSDDTRQAGISTDGSDWIFESKVDGVYRLVDFRNCRNQAAINFGTYLLKDLGGVKIPEGDLY